MGFEPSYFFELEELVMREAPKVEF